MENRTVRLSLKLKGMEQRIICDVLSIDEKEFYIREHVEIVDSYYFKSRTIKSSEIETFSILNYIVGANYR